MLIRFCYYSDKKDGTCLIIDMFFKRSVYMKIRDIYRFNLTFNILPKVRYYKRLINYFKSHQKVTMTFGVKKLTLNFAPV